MKVFLCSLLLITFYLTSSCVRSQNVSENETEITSIDQDSLLIQNRLHEKAAKIKDYLQTHSAYNQKTVILIDMRTFSGKNRLFVYDLDSMKVVSKGLVAHGSGSETGYEDSLIFSNVPNSYCTSLGKYKIGSSYIGSFGKSYKLHGLDPTNNKAYDRLVVLHRYSCVPDNEQEYAICNSLGCAMVSENYFDELDKFISASKKPVIMEIYY